MILSSSVVTRIQSLCSAIVVRQKNNCSMKLTIGVVSALGLSSNKEKPYRKTLIVFLYKSFLSLLRSGLLPVVSTNSWGYSSTLFWISDQLGNSLDSLDRL